MTTAGNRWGRSGNPNTEAIEILRGRDRILNPAYATLASHYRFDPLFCMAAKGQEKSDVERSVYALERRACSPVPRATDLADLNRQLMAFCHAERGRLAAHQPLTIGENFESEKAAAMPLIQKKPIPNLTLVSLWVLSPELQPIQLPPLIQRS